ncbi:MAG: hypothetical protein EBT84_11975, partial [Sphingomonadaceae bacterium]|nr:hypothetical protein [Sphingomonadaceae bacterium]
LPIEALARARRLGRMSATSIDFDTSSTNTTSSAAAFASVVSRPQRGPAKAASSSAADRASARSLVRRRDAE